MTMILTVTILANSVIGGASQYAPGVMEDVIKTRQAGRTSYHLPKYLPTVDGYVARPYPHEIGTIIYLRPVGSEEWESFLVVDCGGVADGGRDWMLRNGILVEVDAETAERWNTVGRLIKVEMMTSPQYLRYIRIQRLLDKFGKAWYN